jgi:hypothetical protein
MYAFGLIVSCLLAPFCVGFAWHYRRTFPQSAVRFIYVAELLFDGLAVGCFGAIKLLQHDALCCQLIGCVAICRLAVFYHNEYHPGRRARHYLQSTLVKSERNLRFALVLATASAALDVGWGLPIAFKISLPAIAGCVATITVVRQLCTAKKLHIPHI